MDDSRLQLLRARVKGLKSTLSQTSENMKKNHVSIALAEDFNKTRDGVAQAFPSAEGSLPARVTSSDPFKVLQKSDVTYLDLEIYADQLLSILDILKPGE